MARRQKDTVSYFPHDTNASAGDTLTVLQSRFGNDGYAFWFKLLEKLADTEGHFLDCRTPIKWQLLLAKTGVNEITGVEIMKLLVEMDAIDKDLWTSKLIWCQNLVDNLAVVYSSRHREPPERPIITEVIAITTGENCILCGKNIADMRGDAKYCSTACKQKAFRVTNKRNAKTTNNAITTEDNSITTEDNPLTTPEMPQSKVKKSRVNKSILSKSSFGEFKNVLLTDEEYRKLEERFGFLLPGMIEDLSVGLASKGYKYKSHYAAILAWHRKDEKRNDGVQQNRRVPTEYSEPYDS